jgi:GTP-binding protein
LGLGEPLPVSSAHGDNVEEMIEIALEDFPLPEDGAEDQADHPKIAIVGRPNVGKSTLVNAILGEDRVIAFDQPGTTRDSIYIDFERGGKHYTIIDTAGVRRRGKIDEAVEKFSVIKTLQAVEDANVVVLVVDARDQITEQDAHIADFVLQAGRALVLAVNKWDGLDDYKRDTAKRDIERKLHFLSFAKQHFISALKGNGIASVLKSVNEAYAAAMAKMPTPQLTRVLEAAVEKQAPPRGRFRPKMRYAHQGGSNPPLIVIHGTGLDNVPDSYRRYLERTFCEAFDLQGTPLRIEFKTGKNPFEGKKRELTESEQRAARRARIRGRKLYG